MRRLGLKSDNGNVGPANAVDVIDDLSISMHSGDGSRPLRLIYAISLLHSPRLILADVETNLFLTFQCFLFVLRDYVNRGYRQKKLTK